MVGLLLTAPTRVYGKVLDLLKTGGLAA